MTNRSKRQISWMYVIEDEAVVPTRSDLRQNQTSIVNKREISVGTQNSVSLCTCCRTSLWNTNALIGSNKWHS